MGVVLTCENCAHWDVPDRVSCYAGLCRLESYPGRVPFNLTCDKHSSKPQEAPPALDQQSQVRGAWGQMWRGVKP